MYYSIAHDWQAAPNVKQVLVFPDLRDRDNFDSESVIKDDQFPYTDSQFQDSDVKGVYIKLRAVLDADDTWASVIRTTDGSMIKMYAAGFQTWEDAIQHAKFRMMLPNL